VARVRRIERRGRPRKANRTVVDRPLDVAAIAQAMPHRRAVRRPELRRDARAETQLGRMLLNGAISELQYDAGVRLRDIVRRWHSVYDMPRFDRGAMPLDGTRKSIQRIIDAERQQRLTRTYLDVWAALIDSVGIGGAHLVVKLCVYDEAPAIAALDVYRLALVGVAKVTGLAR